MAKIAPYLALFIGLAMAVLAVPAAVEELVMRSEVDHFKSTRAEVIDFREQAPGKGPAVQVVKFKYTVNNMKFTGDNRHTRMSDSEEEVNALIRKEKDNRKTILVFYDPSDPRRVVITKEIGVLVPITVIVVTLTLLWTSLYSFYEDRRRRRILARPARTLAPQKIEK